MSRREQIKMSAAEVASFLAEERTVTCATVGPRGWPHLMPLWYVLRGPIVAMAERRAPARVGVDVCRLAEGAKPRARPAREPAGGGGESYEDLRGVMLECDVIIHRDIATVEPLGRAILLRNATPRGSSRRRSCRAGAEMIAAQAVKRVGLEFVERRRASWDHRKLGGVY